MACRKPLLMGRVSPPQERKLLAAVQQMLKDSQLKVALLRMKISSLESSGSPEPGEASQVKEGGPRWPRLRVHLCPAGPDLLAEELQHRLRVEAAVAAGAKNVVKLLGGQRMQDRKALAEVSLCPRLTAVSTALLGSIHLQWGLHPGLLPVEGSKEYPRGVA